MIGKTLVVICGINLFLSAMILVALPYLVTEVLDLEAGQANRLYGFAQGALGAGGLACKGDPCRYFCKEDIDSKIR